MRKAPVGYTVAIKGLSCFMMMITIALAACEKAAIEKGTPACIENRIEDFSKKACGNGAKVDEYTFQGKTVYVFSPGSCIADSQANVVDADCNNLGFLGGITGNTKINGEEFSHASFIRTTWEK